MPPDEGSSAAPAGGTTQHDGHRLVAEALSALGIRHCFAVPAVPVYGTAAACARAGIRVIGARHQQAAGLMALAQGYVGGRPNAVALVSPGPAATNVATALLVAHDNCWPLVVLGGRYPQEAEGKGYFQELDGARLFRPITKWSATANSPAALPAMIGQAFETAFSGRPGPVYLDLPEDVLAGCPPPDAATVSSLLARSGVDGVGSEAWLPQAARDAVARAAEALIAAKRPLLIVGKGLRWTQPWGDLRDLVERLELPFVASPMGRGALPDDHPLSFGAVGWAAQAQADLVMVLGARLDWTFRYGAAIARNATVVQVDVEPGEFSRSRGVQVAVQADAARFLAELRERLDALGATRAAAARDPRWIGTLQALRARRRTEIETLGRCDAAPITPHRLAREVRDVLPRDAILAVDGNVIMAAAQQVIPSFLPASRLNAGSSGCMGVGIPFAIGARLQQPRRAVVALCGDFAAGLSLVEMETAVRHRVPVVVVVANNDGNSGALRQKAWFPPDHPERVTMFQPGVRYDRIMEAFGGYGEHVEEPAAIGPALKRAIASGRPACVNVRVDPDAPYPSN
jgi:2-hydroxyacyl-CoA lyase 1